MAIKSVVINVRTTPDKVQALDAIATNSVGDRSDHLRKALDEYIERNKHLIPDGAAGEPVSISQF